MGDPFFDPTTGELLPDADLETVSRVVNATYEEIDRLRAAVRPLQERRAELRGPAHLPARRNRTALQEQVAACPRCGGPVGEA
jgi:hypothetical protein